MEWDSLAYIVVGVATLVVVWCWLAQSPAFSLSHKHIVLYGCNLHLLKKLTKKCYFEQAKITLLYSSTTDKAAFASTIASLERHIGLAAHIKCLEYDPSKANSSVTQVERNSHGAFEVLIVCSSQTHVESFLDTSVEAVAETMRKNYVETAELMRLVGARMQARGGGRICVIDSANAHLGMPGADSVAAGALSAFADVMRCEFPAVSVLFMGLNLRENSKKSAFYQPKPCLKGVWTALKEAVKAGKSIAFDSSWQAFLSIATKGPTERDSPLADILLASLSALAGLFTYWRLY